MNKKILILNHHGVGDLLMSFPAIRYLSKNTKNEIHMTVSGDFAKMIAKNQRCGDFLMSYSGSFLSKIKTILKIKKIKFDTLIVMWGYEYRMVKVFSILMGIKDIYFSPVDQNEVLKRNIAHKSERHLKIVLKYLKINYDKNFILDYKFDNISYFLKDRIISNNYIVYICGSGETERYKRWSPGKYAKLAELIEVNHKNISIIIIGSKDEKEIGDSIMKISNAKNIVNLSGKLNENELKSILINGMFAIGGDCGGMHIAKACGTKVVVMTGPTNASLTAPIHTDLNIDKNMVGRPWYNKDSCKKNVNIVYDESMNFSVKEVYKKIIPYLYD